jgi:hypothetical protein
MSSPINAQVNGTFTTDATPSSVFISLPPGYTDIKITDVTDFAGGAGIIIAEGNINLPANTAVTYTGGAPFVLATSATGFTFIADSAFSFLTPAVAVTAITNASPAVVSSASPAVVGSIVRIYDPLGMLQIGGWDFLVTAVNPGVTQTLGTLSAGAGQLNFAAPATGGTISVLNFNPRYYPQIRRITNIVSAGTSSVITLNVPHTYTVGQKVRIVIPKLYGMQEMNGSPTSGFGKGLLGTITAIGLTGIYPTSITVDIDSSGFSAFSFPTSAQGATGIGAPEVIPVGEAALVPYANLLDDATRNQSQTGVYIDASILQGSALYTWVAYKGTSI